MDEGEAEPHPHDQRVNLQRGCMLLRYIAPLYCASGYGAASRHQFLTLAGLGVELDPIAAMYQHRASGRIVDAVATLACRREGEPAGTVFHCTPDVYEKLTTHYQMNGPRPHIGVVVWETSRLPQEWVGIINEGFDYLWVPTEWQMGVMKASGVTVPMVYMPFALDPKFYPCRAELGGRATPKTEKIATYFARASITPSTTVFYSCFQWTERKNPLGLLAAYTAAFSAADDVALILKTYGRVADGTLPGYIEQAFKGFRHPKPPKLLVIEEMLSDDELLDLSLSASVYVGLSRGEGWGLPAHEAALTGCPLVLTEGSAPTETYGSIGLFGGACQVPSRLAPVWGMDWLRWYGHPQCWWDPDPLMAAEVLRALHENSTFRQAKAFGCAQQSALYTPSALEATLRFGLSCTFGGTYSAEVA